MSRNFVILAVVLPLLAIVFGIVRAERTIDRSKDYVFDIQGFDPRDLLRGRYLQFRLRIDPPAEREPCDASKGQSCCLCLSGFDADFPPYVQRATCKTARTSCDAALLERYSTEAMRFYVPEEHAASLEQRLFKAMEKKSAQVILAIDEQGNATVRELLLEGKAIPGGVPR